MIDAETTLLAMRERVQAFVHARDWEQFHNAKDLATAIAIEAAELMELFLWKTPSEVELTVQAADSRHRIAEELADVLILCLSLANRLDIDVATAVSSKVQANEAKYPADLVRGKADKYTTYGANSQDPQVG
jgi:NTP pyrophosphatase (non-canonical NTP hydrolase)